MHLAFQFKNLGLISLAIAVEATKHTVVLAVEAAIGCCCNSCTPEMISFTDRVGAAD